MHLDFRCLGKHLSSYLPLPNVWLLPILTPFGLRLGFVGGSTLTPGIPGFVVRTNLDGLFATELSLSCPFAMWDLRRSEM